MCRYWSHKKCEDLGYGRNPPNFVCQGCGGFNPVSPSVTILSSFPVSDYTAFVEINRTELVQHIPEGAFRAFVLASLNRTELRFYETVSRFFNAFCGPLFDEDPHLWRIFTDTLTQLLGCTQEVLCQAIDFLACQILYNFGVPEPPSLFVALDRFSLSERATIAAKATGKSDRQLAPVAIIQRNGRPCVGGDVQDGGFICEIPGFVCLFSEMRAEVGLNLKWISIPHTEFVIDTSETSFVICQNIRRSFHFNCEPKIVRSHGEIRVILIAHRMCGPLMDKAVKRRLAIPNGGELILPLDADLPYPVPTVDWREKKMKVKSVEVMRGINTERKKKGETEDRVSLLSLFYDPFAPPLPMQVMSAEEMSQKEKGHALWESSRILTRHELRKREQEKGI
jgi:hypothetical protein